MNENMLLSLFHFAVFFNTGNILLSLTTLRATMLSLLHRTENSMMQLTRQKIEPPM